MNYYMTVEPLIKSAYWCEQYIKGIKCEVKNRKGTLMEISLGQTDELLRYAKNQRIRPVLIVNCISQQWTLSCVLELKQHNIHPLIIAPYRAAPYSPASLVSFDFKSVFYELCQYMFDSGREKIALFGVNPNSINDSAKVDAFSLFCKNYNMSFPEKQIFWNRGNLGNCCREFHDRADEFNAVVCSNDVVAIKIMNYFKKYNIKVPDDMYVASMGNTSLSKFITPDITICELDCEQIGKQAVKMNSILCKNSDIASLNAIITGKVIPRGSTAFSPVTRNTRKSSDSLPEELINFYSDADVNKIFRMEHLISSCDELDMSILYGIICGKHISDLAEETFLTESTIKYRIKKIHNFAKTSTRKELVELFTSFL